MGLVLYGLGALGVAELARAMLIRDPDVLFWRNAARDPAIWNISVAIYTLLFLAAWWILAPAAVVIGLFRWGRR